MAVKKDSAKGNPAHKRIGNAHRKAYRASLWAKQQKRKAARREAQAERERINRERGYTAWEAKKRARLG